LQVSVAGGAKKFIDFMEFCRFVRVLVPAFPGRRGTLGHPFSPAVNFKQLGYPHSHIYVAEMH